MSDRSRRFEGEQWSLAVFSAREDATRLAEAVLAAANAHRAGASLTLDVLVNGNATLAKEMRGRFASADWWQSGTVIRLWSMPEPDKASAWNHYLHALVPEGDLAFFMDGYVTVEPDALALMADAFRERPAALAATSMPSTGRSAPGLRRRFLAEGGLHGNLYALSGHTISRLRDSAFRLPSGIYRNDSALGAALAFNLDPGTNNWNWDRIAVVPDAEYHTPTGDPTRLSDIKVQLRRRLRQAQGHLETCALKAHLADAKRSPFSWPSTARELVLQWADEHPADVRSLAWTDPLAWATLLRIRRQSGEARSEHAVQCLGQYSPLSAATATAQRVAVSEH